MKQMRHEQILIDGQLIHYATAGDGLPVLLLHGWGANLQLMVPLAEKLVTAGFSIYAPDLPGFGSSPEPQRAWTVYDYADCVLGFLDALQLDRVFLFGHSFGGRLGLILASRNASRIRKMALSDAAGIRPAQPLTQKLRLHLYRSIRDGLYTVGAKSLADRLRVLYNRRYGSSDFQQVSGIMRETFIRVINEDLLPCAKQVSVSTILFWGDQDMDTPLWMGKMLEQAIPDAGLIVHQGAGHYAYLDRLAETARVMDYFFRQE
jgi:pimeloyl-ACP methyl ester carboxylesterase